MTLKINFFLFVALAASYGWADNSTTWETKHTFEGVPQARVQIDAQNKKVYFTFLKENNLRSRALGMTLKDSLGNKTSIELKAMEQVESPRRYVGIISGTESVVGLEIRIPLGSERSTVIGSDQVVQIKK